MTNNSARLSDLVSRRKFLLASGTAGVTVLAGCSDGVRSSEDTSDSSNSSSLKADGSSTVYPITSKAGSLWNSNPAADDEEYWGPSQYDIETDKNLADYWAGLYGFETNDDGSPPFEASIGLNHTGVGLEKLEKGRVDIGDASAPVAAEFPDRSEEELKPFVDHVIAVDAQPIMVSKSIIDEGGIESITIEDVQAIYRGEIEVWLDIEGYDGPDKEIQAVGRSEGSGTDTSFRANVLGDPNASMDGVDVRKGENQQVKTLIEQSDNAIAYAGLAFVSENAPILPLKIDGTVYTRDKMAAKDYPLARDLHTYTWEDTSKKEAAFIRMIMHEYGQKNFVEPADYLPLTDERREEELSKLPEPEA